MFGFDDVTECGVGCFGCDYCRPGGAYDQQTGNLMSRSEDETNEREKRYALNRRAHEASHPKEPASHEYTYAKSTTATYVVPFTHQQVIDALSEAAAKRVKLGEGERAEAEVRLSADTSWEAEGKGHFTASVTLTQVSK